MYFVALLSDMQSPVSGDQMGSSFLLPCDLFCFLEALSLSRALTGVQFDILFYYCQDVALLILLESVVTGDSLCRYLTFTHPRLHSLGVFFCVGNFLVGPF